MDPMTKHIFRCLNAHDMGFNAVAKLAKQQKAFNSNTVFMLTVLTGLALVEHVRIKKIEEQVEEIQTKGD